MTTEFLEKLGIRVHSETDSEIRCFCPFHEDDNPSSSFSKSKGVFNCFCYASYGVNAFSLWSGRTVHCIHDIVPSPNPGQI